MNNKILSTTRFTESFLLALVFVIALLGFALLAIGMQVKQGADIWSGLPGALLPPLVIGISSAGLHYLMCKRGMQVSQLILPVSMLLFHHGAADDLAVAGRKWRLAAALQGVFARYGGHSSPDREAPLGRTHSPVGSSHLFDGPAFAGRDRFSRSD